MTIAVSVVVKPSRLQTATYAALCAAIAGIGFVVVCGAVGELPLLVRLACLFTLLALAIGCYVHVVGKQVPCQLDISGTGQIRLTLQTKQVDRTDISNNGTQQRSLLVTLLPDSTIWPRFMVLRLRDDRGRVHALSVWPDSVPQTSFRALAVACRWIAAHRFA
jgi:toxin CptA